MDPDDPLLKECAELIFSTWRKDGRFKLNPQDAIYPCHTINAANVLCQLGYADDARLQQTFQHLLRTQHVDGGWRCNKFSFGHGAETEYSNPLPTLNALHMFRFTDYINKNLHSIGPLIFCLNIGRFVNRLARVTLESERYSCKWRTHSKITISSSMYTFSRFIIKPKTMNAFWKPWPPCSLNWSTERSWSSGSFPN